MWKIWIAAAGIAVGTIGCHPRQHSISKNTGATDTEVARSPVPLFDAAHAYRLIEQQIAFGPRAPGLPGHDSCRRFLRQFLTQYADTVFEQPFSRQVYGVELRLTNIGASFRTELPVRVLLCAHWDTRPYADEELEPRNQRVPILGANDGGSGVAVLLELARVLSQHPPPIGVDILLLDGEDYGKAGDMEHFCLGSRYAAHHYPFPILPRWVVVVDLVGDREAWLPWEEYSWRSAPELLQVLWEIGAKHAPSVFRKEMVAPVFDDHVPFIQAGFRAIVIIDAELVGNRSPNPRRRYWHTLRDTPQNISQGTLRAVGQTLVEWLYKAAP
ncbi:MAG: M28 family peptidase [Candidatus Kapabacteria bacterium]|nr:M28 family peptidase [Candidatus Kapabacteria bacterium]MDW7996501.1 M28 family peptidase [Bacteroidota bacterium]